MWNEDSAEEKKFKKVMFDEELKKIKNRLPKSFDEAQAKYEAELLLEDKELILTSAECLELEKFRMKESLYWDKVYQDNNWHITGGEIVGSDGIKYIIPSKEDRIKSSVLYERRRLSKMRGTDYKSWYPKLDMKDFQ